MMIVYIFYLLKDYQKSRWYCAFKVFPLLRKSFPPPPKGKGGRSNPQQGREMGQSTIVLLQILQFNLEQISLQINLKINPPNSHYILLLDVNFDKSTIIIVHFFYIYYILHVFKISKISKINNYVINQIKCINFKFLQF